MPVRLLSAGRRSDEELAFARMGLPVAAREYLENKLLPLELLLTGLHPEESRLLRRLHDASRDSGAFPLYFAHRRPSGEEDGLLSGRLEQARRLTDAVGEAPEGQALAVGLRRALAALDPPAPLTLGRRRWEFGQRTYVMGVVNVTPDSFSDGGQFAGVDEAVAHALRLVEAGADLLDVGGESTRPGAEPVPAATEIQRVVPVIAALCQKTDVPVSVDTRKAEVAAGALQAGALLVNDVSGLTFDPDLASVVAGFQAALCVMHMRGTPATMQRAPVYQDVVEEVTAELADGLARAEAAGVPAERILIDPGIGFAKTVDQQLFLLRRLPELRVLGRPLLVGTSRKSFLGALTGGKPAGERLPATLGSVAAIAALGGADVVRAHDVAEVKDALTLVDAIRSARGGGARY